MQNKTQPIPENPDVVKGYTTPIFDCYYCEMEKEEEPVSVAGREVCCSDCAKKHTIICHYCGKHEGRAEALLVEKFCAETGDETETFVLCDECGMDYRGRRISL